MAPPTRDVGAHVGVGGRAVSRSHPVWKAERKKSAGRMVPRPALPVPKGVVSSREHLARGQYWAGEETRGTGTAP